MFNECELDFIEETVERDLRVVNLKIEKMVDELALTGQRLSQLKVIQSKLMSINDAIQGHREDEECE